MRPIEPPQRDRMSQQERLRRIRRAGRAELRHLARSLRWEAGDLGLLGWIMAQKSIDLDTALAVFLNGDPERFNYLAKREVPRAHQPTVQLLDAICLRLNSGFYRPRPAIAPADRARLMRWLAFQAADRAEGRCGRWILDEEIVAPALPGAAAAPEADDPVAALRAAARRPWMATLREWLRAVLAGRSGGDMAGRR